MKEPKPMGEQMRDRADILEKALGLRLWCWQFRDNPFTFETGFDLKISVNLDLRERELFQDIERMKSALLKSIEALQDKLKEVKEYEHHNKS